MDNYKEITIDSYRKNASVFAENFKGVFDLEKRKEFTEFMNYLNGKFILDVGCGAGDHSLWFQKKGLIVTAIDISPQMVEISKTKGVNAKIMDMENLNFQKSSFDGIWAVTSLLHLKKNTVSKVLSSFSSILTNSGILFVVIKEGNEEGLFTDRQNMATKRYFAYWQKEEFLNLLDDHFELIDFWRSKPRNSVFLHFLARKKNFSLS